MTTSPRIRPASHGLHYSFEKAGLTLDRQPIPWNAEAVLVEATVRAPGLSAARLAEYGLHLPGGARIPAESFRETSTDLAHVFFRLAVPPETTPAEIRWRDRSLGQINLPILARQAFLGDLKIAEPTLHVRWKDEAYACQAYVHSQAKELIASMLLSSPTSLAPLADIDIGLDVVRGDDTILERSVRLESQQLASRQALVVVPLGKPAKALEEWAVRWRIAGEARTSLNARGYRPSDFQRSLRISTTRLYLEGDGGMLPLVRQAPPTWDGITRFGPVFLVSSGIVGMAGRAEFRIDAVDIRGRTLFELPSVETLVTDSPTVIAPGTIGVNPDIDRFDLWCRPRRLGSLALVPVPTAAFTPEGGIAAARDDFAWSRDAESELQRKLGQLLGG